MSYLIVDQVGRPGMIIPDWLWYDAQGGELLQRAVKVFIYAHCLAMTPLLSMTRPGLIIAIVKGPNPSIPFHH
jgi:hypothetical protein